MHHQRKLVLLAALLAAGLPTASANAQSANTPNKQVFEPSPSSREDAGSVLDCPRPGELREAKVIDFDPASSVARLAVNVGSGRFTLVTIKTWDRAEDPRPLNPVLAAAKIMQGKLQFFSRQLTTNPSSAVDEYLVMTEMGGGYVCWAKPTWLMHPANPPMAEAPAPVKPVIAPAVVTPATTPNLNPGTAPSPIPGAITPLETEPGFRRGTRGRRAATSEQ
jgi:hypothetical protein